MNLTNSSTFLSTTLLSELLNIYVQIAIYKVYRMTEGKVSKEEITVFVDGSVPWDHSAFIPECK